jgi:hypothetical protein
MKLNQSKLNGSVTTKIRVSDNQDTAVSFPQCHEHGGSRDPSAGLVTRQDWLSHRQPKLAKTKASAVPEVTFARKQRLRRGGKLGFLNLSRSARLLASMKRGPMISGHDFTRLQYEHLVHGAP